jgi:hypothetical protein
VGDPDPIWFEYKPNRAASLHAPSRIEDKYLFSKQFRWFEWWGLLCCDGSKCVQGGEPNWSDGLLGSLAPVTSERSVLADAGFIYSALPTPWAAGRLRHHARIQGTARLLRFQLQASTLVNLLRMQDETK